MATDTLLDGLGSSSSWDRALDGSWVEIADLDARAMTRLLTKAGARWVTMTVTPAGDGFRVIYHWDLDGDLLNVATRIAGKRLDSVADLLPAAEWVEREMHDYYALEFLGRDETPALMLRPEDEPGLFSRTQDLGRGADPAEYVDPAANSGAAEYAELTGQDEPAALELAEEAS